MKYGKYIDIFCWKKLMWVAWKSCSHFYSKNINVFVNTAAATVNYFVINKLVKLMMLWSTRLWSKHLTSQFNHLLMCQKAAVWVSNSVGPDQMHALASDLGLHGCLGLCVPILRVFTTTKLWKTAVNYM